MNYLPRIWQLTNYKSDSVPRMNWVHYSKENDIHKTLLLYQDCSTQALLNLDYMQHYFRTCIDLLLNHIYQLLLELDRQEFYFSCMDLNLTNKKKLKKLIHHSSNLFII